MGLSYLLNGFGMVIGASLAGIAFARGHEAYATILAVALFGLSMALPLFREYNALRQGFQGVEEIMEEKQTGPEPVEVFGPEPESKVSWMVRPLPRWLYGALSGLAVGLILFDAAALMFF
jgi:hypothetical protein